MEDSKRIMILAVALVFIFGLIGFFALQSNQPGKYDGFAQCLGTKGLKFYGAFWCPHCQEQKALFGASSKLLPYIECGTSDTHVQTPICNANNINRYPTWVFPNGARLEGGQTLETLAASSTCALPQ